MTASRSKNILFVLGLFVSSNSFTESLPDPTRPTNYSSRPISVEEVPQEFINWDVRAIRSSEGGRNAIVNGRLVKVGDEIDSATIVDITANTVVLDHGRQQLVLRLMPKDIKKKHSDILKQENQFNQ